MPILLTIQALTGILYYKQQTLRYQTDNITAVAILLGSIYLNGAKEGNGAENRRKLSPSFSFFMETLYRRTAIPSGFL